MTQAWTNALSRARDLAPGRLRYLGVRGRESRFAVTSATNNVTYLVRVRERDGRMQAACGCKAAQNHRPCWHRAACAEACSWPLEAA